MRKLFVILSLIIAANALAAPVSREQAMKEAAAFVAKKSPTHAKKLMKSPAMPQALKSEGNGDEAYYYLFNVGDGNGFVIVSGDDRTESILAYSDEGTIDPAHMPDNMRYWLNCYADQLKALDKMDDLEAAQAVGTARKARVNTRNPIAPLITTKWDQATPYWNDCPQFMNSDDPDDGYELAYTGCVATSMSQIMYFYKQPKSISEPIPSYTFNVVGDNFNYSTVTMEEQPPTTFDWEHMRETYTGAEDEVYTSAVSQLMLYVGCSVKTQYGISSSGAYTDDIPKGFARFGYGAKIAFRTDYDQTEWEDLVYSELAAGRPMIYNGTAGSGGGHSFVCDGFEYGDYFHINWGWGGMGNGFFQLSILNPSASGIGGSSSSEGYNMKQNIIYEILPGTAQGGGSDDPEEVENKLTVTAISGTSYAFLGRDKLSDPFKIGDTRRVKVSFADHFNSGQKYEVALGLYNPTNKELEVMGNSLWNAGVVTTAALGDTHEFGAGLKPSGYGPDPRITFGAGKTGDFHIVPIYRLQGTDEWQLMDKADRYYIEVSLYSTMTSDPIYHPEKKLEVSFVSFTGEDKVGSKEQVHATIENYGDERFFGNLYLDFGGQQLDEYSQYTTVVQAEVPAQGSSVITFNVTPESAGVKTVYVMTEDGYGGYDVLPGTTAEIEIKGVEEAEMDLSVDIEATNAESTDDENVHGVIFDSHARFKATITNNSTGEYNKYVLAPLFIVHRNEDGTIGAGSMVTYKQQAVSIPAGGSKTYFFEFDNLAYGSTYSMNIYARNNVPQEEEGTHVENIVEKGKSKYYEIERGIVTWKGDGTRQGNKPVEGFVVPEDVAAVLLEGLNLGNIAASNNPNTLYFLGEGETAPAGLEGKNIVAGSQADVIALEDGYDFYTPQTFTASEISYKRTFTQGHNNKVRTGWSTIVLPFQPTKVMNLTDGKQLDWFHSSTDSGKQFWLCDFAEEDGQTVYFRNAPEMLANVPYLVAVPDNAWGAAWNLVGKEISWSATNATVKPDAIAYTSGQNMAFAGSVYKQNLRNVLGLTADGSQFSSSGAQNVDAFHAYFKSIGETPYFAKTVDIAIIGEETDGIAAPDLVEEAEQTGVIYDISGRRLSTPSSQYSTLPKGVYIINGKKVLK